MSSYIFQCEDAIEPIADTLGEIWGNAPLYNTIWPDGGSCAATYNLADMTVTGALGAITHYGIRVPTASVTWTLVSDPSLPRWTWRGYSSAGAAVVVSGDPAATPTVPELGDRVANGLDYVQAGLTIANNATHKLDKRNAAPIYSTFDGILQAFRQNRRLVAEFAAGGGRVDPTGIVNYNPVGNGFQLTATDQTALVNVGGEPVYEWATGSSYTGGIVSGNTNALLAVLPPNKNPRMLVRVLFPASGAGLTNFNAGFFDANSATANGAYLRLLTTGHVFFVTRQGGAESATDLGILSRVAVLGFTIETVDAGVTWVCSNQAGTVLATHTTNVPTAATALGYGVAVILTSSSQVSGVAYCRVEGTIA